MDIVDRQTRSHIMAQIRGKNTRPELIVRKGLHARGFRFRLHRPDLPGKPDIVLPKYRAVILVNGCFWHGHDCHLFKWPGTRQDWWRAKIGQTQIRDARNRKLLVKQGWRILTVWECALKGKRRIPKDTVIEQAVGWLVSDSVHAEIRGENLS